MNLGPQWKTQEQLGERKPVYKKCPCCGVEFTKGQFLAMELPDSGKEYLFDEDGNIEARLRNCKCGSTICVEI